MVPPTVRNAMDFLAAKADRAVDRDTVVAHATLAAWVHHYPSRVMPEIVDYISRFSWIREAESSRWIRQRRVALVHILNELKADSGEADARSHSRDERCTHSSIAMPAK